MDALAAVLDFSMTPPSLTPARVLPQLYLGSFAHTQDEDVLRKCNITNIVYCCLAECVSNKDVPWPMPWGTACHISFDAKDDADYDILSAHYKEVSDFINHVSHVGGCTLLSCNQGINRSGVLAIAFVADKLKCSIVEAARHVVSVRGQVCTNKHFQKKLIAFANARDWPIV